MFGMTRNDLQKKSRAQLAALFNQVSREAADTSGSAKSAQAQSLLAMIRQEQARRGPTP